MIDLSNNTALRDVHITIEGPEDGISDLTESVLPLARTCNEHTTINFVLLPFPSRAFLHSQIHPWHALIQELERRPLHAKCVWVIDTRRNTVPSYVVEMKEALERLRVQLLLL